MKAVVMAGGLGSRLHPLTNGCPKPLVPFINKPVLAHVLSLLKRHHFSEVIITIQYLAHQFQEYFGDGNHPEMTLRYVVEETPLGTAGCVKNVQSYLGDEPFLVISGDVITDINLSDFLQFHKKKQALATLALTHVAMPQKFGVVITDSDGRIRQYVEKPDRSRVVSNLINTGIYVLEPEVLDYMESGKVYDFSYDIFPCMLKQNAPLFGYISHDYWHDMGTLQSYLQATVDALAGKINYIDLKQPLGSDIWLDQNVAMMPCADSRKVAFEAIQKLTCW